jgi:hypothetical protein
MCLRKRDLALARVTDDETIALISKGESTVTHFQVFGERRSGTNFLNKLIADNLRAFPTRKYGWKHGHFCYPAISSNALIVVVVRDPYDWLVSMYTTQFHYAQHLRSLRFSEFIRQPWETIAAPTPQAWIWFGYDHRPNLQGEIMQLDRHPITGRQFRNIIEMRSVKLHSHLGILNRAENVCILRLEDTRRNSTKVVDKISKIFDIEVKGEYRMISEKIGPKSNPKRIAVSDIAADDLRFIRSELDHDLERCLGYLP